MSHYCFNRQELLEKAKDKYHNGGGKEKATEYYIGFKEVIKKRKKQVQKFGRRLKTKKRI